MLTCHLEMKMKRKTEYIFLMYRFFVKIKHLPLLSTVDLPFIHIYTQFDSFLTSSYKFRTVYTLFYRRFRICSSWNKLHTELISLKQVFLKNGLPENFMNVSKDLRITYM